jgi:hypothetical protein
MDRKTRKVVTVHGQHHTGAETDRLCVSRNEKGRGLMQIEGTYAAEGMKFMEYVESKGDAVIKIVRTHQHDTNSTLLETVKNFKKSFQSDTKQIKV